MAPKKFFSKSFLLFHPILYRRLMSGRLYRRSLSAKFPKFPPQPLSPPELDDISDKTLVIDMESWLLKSNSTFSFFMLVAMEGGSYLRGLLLLILYPFLLALDEGLRLRVMVMVCFFGMKVDWFKLDRAVLPKYFLENVTLEGFEVLRKGLEEAKAVVCVSRMMPRVMVDAFLKEYMGVKEVVGREIGVKYGYFSGVLMDLDEQELGKKLETIGGDVLEFGSSFGERVQQKNHPLSFCKVRKHAYACSS